MNLLSVKFAFLLIASLILYYVLPKKTQWICLLVASLSFYYFTGVKNFIFIAITAVTTFFAAMIINSFNENVVSVKTAGNLSKDEFREYKLKIRNKKRWILFTTLVINFGILAALKYWNTIILSLDLNVAADLSFLLINHGKGLLLPLGISFYTFQAIAYLLDVYNSKISNEKNFFRYLLFVSFFPQLIQGPINRYDKLGKDLSVPHDFEFENLKEGVLLFVYGAMKKYAVADMLVNILKIFFDTSYNNLPGSAIAFGIFLYAIYQYADFSGGIDMVLGIAKLFGIKMQPNFKQPYFSTSLADFWRRWHISLGLWMKDYVFYPFVLTNGMQNFTKSCSKLGKHFARAIPAGIANILVFLIVGIWHGPEMHYVLWGLYNGLIIALSDLLKPVFTKVTEKLHINTKAFGWKVFQIIRTFIIVNIGWYFDRIYDVKKSFVFLKNTFVNFKISEFKDSVLFLLKDNIFLDSPDVTAKFFISAFATVIIFMTSIGCEKKGDLYTWWKSKNIVLRWAFLYLILLVFIISLSYSTGTPGFMYANY